MNNHVKTTIIEHIKAVNYVFEMEELIINCVNDIKKRLKNGGKIFICGNGGSAADAQHFAAELVGRFEKDRKGIPATALSTDTSCLTAIGNDFGFEYVFSRQIEALAKPEDIVIGISTSGNSENVYRALLHAKKLRCLTIGLTGRNGGTLQHETDYLLNIPVQRTCRIQETHIMLIHILCGLIEHED